MAGLGRALWLPVAAPAALTGRLITGTGRAAGRDRDSGMPVPVPGTATASSSQEPESGTGWRYAARRAGSAAQAHSAGPAAATTRCQS